MSLTFSVGIHADRIAREPRSAQSKKTRSPRVIRLDGRARSSSARPAYLEAGGVVEFGGGGADEHGVAAGGDGEVAAALVEVRQVAGEQAEQDEPALPGGEIDLGVALELLGRLLRGSS
jgi:hypothetical protein